MIWFKKIQSESTGNFNRFIILVSILMFILAVSADVSSRDKKKLYISSIKPEGVSKGVADSVRNGLKLAIFEKYGNRYYVLDDEAIKVMYRQAERILASGCTDRSCITQIADGINADEIIYGTVKKHGGKLQLVLNNLVRSRKTLTLGTKSIVNISFFERYLDHFVSEAAMKLINKRYSIRSEVKIAYDEKVRISGIKVAKVKGIDISALDFTSRDSAVNRMLGYLKDIVDKGDIFYNRNEFGEARTLYNGVLTKIKTKLSRDKQRKMGGFIGGVERRLAATYVTKAGGELRDIDSKLKREKEFEINTLESYLERYRTILEEVPYKYRKTHFAAVSDRMDRLYMAIAAKYEKNGDAAYREYTFEDAMWRYQVGKLKAERISDGKKRREHVARLQKKISTTKITGESYLTNELKSLMDQAEFYNLQGKDKEARTAMERAKKLMGSYSFTNNAMRIRFNKVAEVTGVDKLVLLKEGSGFKQMNIGGYIFVYIKGGKFMMGSPDGEGDSDERPRHRVYVDSFWMGKYEVTQKVYYDIMEENPSNYPREKYLPVNNVERDEAIEFCKKFGKKYGVKVRLPYEAEWEYACRAGSKTAYYWGSVINGDFVWYYDNSNGEVHPVGIKKPNAWGIHDMSGNVWEWCIDIYDKNYYSVSPDKNPKGPDISDKVTYRVLRGGSYNKWADKARSSKRSSHFPYRSNNNYGFRILLIEE